MTRRLPGLSLSLCLAIAATAAGQTAGPSRYLPPRTPAGQPTQGQPAPQQPARNFGPQPQIRQAQAQQPIRPPVNNAGPPPAAPIAPQAPAWVPLDAAQQKWVDDILAYWELASGKIKTFECKFDRFDYDPVFGPRTEAKTIAQGKIKYAQPDKGLYHVEKLFSYVGPPKAPGEKAEYAEQDATFGEHWVCDGKLIHSFEAQKKQVTVSHLPPELQGRAIVDGPLPFLFGAKAETIKARYWVRVLPETGNGKFWLEAVPKSRQDAQNFKMIHIVLDEKKFLPETLFLFAPNFDPQKNPSKTTHIFKDIKTDDDRTLQQKIVGGLDPLGLFIRDFYNVAVPRGWKRVVDSGLPIASETPLEAKTRPDVPQRPIPTLPR
jgi:TIGR03009 family protein